MCRGASCCLSCRAWPGSRDGEDRTGNGIRKNREQMAIRCGYYSPVPSMLSGRSRRATVERRAGQGFTRALARDLPECPAWCWLGRWPRPRNSNGIRRPTTSRCAACMHAVYVPMCLGGAAWLQGGRDFQEQKPEHGATRTRACRDGWVWLDFGPSFQNTQRTRPHGHTVRERGDPAGERRPGQWSEGK